MHTDEARLAAYDTLRAVSDREAYANLVLPKLLTERRLDARDAALATELAYGVLRGLGTYDAILAECVDRPLDRLDPEILDLLRLGAHQLLATRVPPHAAVATTVDLARAVVHEGAARMVNAVLRRVDRDDLRGWVDRVAPDPSKDPEGYLAIYRAHPRLVVSALWDSLAGHRGAETAYAEIDHLLEADNVPPGVTLAARPGLSDQAELVKQGAEPGRYAPTAAYLGEGDPARIEAVARGRVGVQDEGSQLVALALAAVPLETPASNRPPGEERVSNRPLGEGDAGGGDESGGRSSEAAAAGDVEDELAGADGCGVAAAVDGLTAVSLAGGHGTAERDATNRPLGKEGAGVDDEGDDGGDAVGAGAGAVGARDGVEGGGTGSDGDSADRDSADGDGAEGGDSASAAELWLDLCAGPGGKAALLGAIAAQRGARLIAAEVAPHRARLVKRAMQPIRGIPWVVNADGIAPPFRPGTFSRVLVDAPCTGLGALRRRPESRWRRTPASVPELASLQYRLLSSALSLVRPGGVVAYVTCSPHLAETRSVVAAVLASRSGFSQIDARPFLPGVPDLGSGPDVQLWPHLHGTDAMYLALIRRHLSD
jgi:16S rRNA (cytosine967-C5)-methyltransferase